MQRPHDSAAATAKDYADAFDLNPAGARCLRDLIDTFHSGPAFIPGEDGRRQTDFNLGARAVLDFILARMDAGVHGKEINHVSPEALPPAR